MTNPQVKVALCNCGKARMMATAVMTNEVKAEMESLMDDGFQMLDMSLNEAKQLGMCFTGLHGEKFKQIERIYKLLKTASPEALRKVESVLMGYPGNI